MRLDELEELMRIARNVPENGGIETADGKQRFVVSLTVGVAYTIIEDIRRGIVPASWDGRELRQLIFDRAARQTIRMDRGRERKYRNDLATLDL